MVDTEASKASARKGMRVRVPPRVLEGLRSKPPGPEISSLQNCKRILSKTVVSI